jgi:hypothetical protein
MNRREFLETGLAAGIYSTSARAEKITPFLFGANAPSSPEARAMPA